MPAAIHPIAGANVYAQLDYPFSDRLAITKVAGLHLPQANADASLRHPVAKTVKPLRERFAPVVALLAK